MARVTPPGDSLFAASLLFFLLPLCALESAVAERLPLLRAVNAVEPDTLALAVVQDREGIAVRAPITPLLMLPCSYHLR